MSLHKCPKCSKIAFTWFVDEEVSVLTIWGCWECNYRAFEDESKESKCPDCNSPGRIELKDEYSEYWWCIRCERITKTTN